MRMNLKLAIIAAGIKHQALAITVNKRLGDGEHLSELDITKLITERKEPTPKQAAALARVLGRPAADLLPQKGGL